jgi:hypothetical protein
MIKISHIGRVYQQHLFEGKWVLGSLPPFVRYGQGTWRRGSDGS